MCLPEYISKCGRVPEILRLKGGASYSDFPLCPAPSPPPSSPPSAPPSGRRFLADPLPTTARSRRRAALADRSGWAEAELEALLHQYAQQQRRGGGGGASGASGGGADVDAAAEASAAAVLSRLGPLGRATALPTFGAALSRASSAARKEEGRLEQVRAFVRDVLGLGMHTAGGAAGMHADGRAKINDATFTRAVRELAASRAAAAEARAFRRKLQEGFDEEATSCLMDASTYCLSIEIISECPGSLDLMRAKTIPFSSEAGTPELQP
jgi:hypothetical protein